MPVRSETHLKLDPDKLLRELKLRGASAADVAKATGISATTLSGVLRHGRPVAAFTARKIAKWLLETPPVDGLAELLAGEAA